MPRFLMPLAISAGLALGSPLAAEPAYSTEQLVDFFINSIDMGATRGICIGTPAECDKPAAPQGLDMRVTFELDSATLTPEARDSLGVFAQMMQDERLEIARFVVEGHTDARGSDDYNLQLSEDRAAAVRAFLTGLGVAPERLTALGFGKSQPRTPDALDPENRRVELRIDLR